MQGSGIPYATAQALQAHCGDVIELGPFPTRPPPPMQRLLWAVERRLTGRSFRWKSSRACCGVMSREVAAALGKSACDLIFAPRAGWSIGALETTLPMVIYGDATMAAMRRMGGYDYVDRLAGRSLRQGIEIERRLHQRATTVLVSSDWARRSVLDDYGVAPERVFVTPNGANLLDAEVPAPRRLQFAPSRQQCGLLMVGGPWHRKGGDIVFATLLELIRRGIPTRLSVVGATPPPGVAHPALTAVGRLNKNCPADAAHLGELYRAADFLFVPSRGEAFGTIYAEAAAFGVPSIAADIGGVGTAVLDDRTGVLLDPAATPADYADHIAAVWQDRNDYERLARGARAYFDSRLNWTAWGRQTADVLRRTLPPHLAGCVGGAPVLHAAPALSRSA
jgi:glycosyltransferase involved in cell wall biosynthesis